MDVEIWRWDHLVSASRSGTYVRISSNIAARAIPGTVLDVCQNVITSNGNAFLGGSDMPSQSDNINIAEKFTVQDSSGNTVRTGCTYSGTYTGPNAQPGYVASGTLACDNGFSVPCFQSENNLAMNCGTGPMNGCDLLTGTCLPYYQLLAYCRI